MSTSFQSAHAECPIVGCAWRSRSWTDNAGWDWAMQEWDQHKANHTYWGPRFITDDLIPQKSEEP